MFATGEQEIHKTNSNVNYLRKRDIKSAHQNVIRIQRDPSVLSSSSNNFNAISVNVNKILLEEGSNNNLNAKKAGLRPQSSMGRKVIGQREIRYIKKKVHNNFLDDDNFSELKI